MNFFLLQEMTYVKAMADNVKVLVDKIDMFHKHTTHTYIYNALIWLYNTCVNMCPSVSKCDLYNIRYQLFPWKDLVFFFFLYHGRNYDFPPKVSFHFVKVLNYRSTLYTHCLWELIRYERIGLFFLFMRAEMRQLMLCFVSL